MKNPIIISGPQGSFKTTIADYISRSYCISVTATRDDYSGYVTDSDSDVSILFIIDECTNEDIPIISKRFEDGNFDVGIVFITSEVLNEEIIDTSKFNIIDLY